jgi:tRNA threonylcarbamoyl adenosine modification protein (Sua5/YciO/YrdC/YwlC family)
MIVSEDEAIAALAGGSVVAVPTDTVYGLAVDPSRSGATATLFALKGRPHDVALPVLVAVVDQARLLVATDAWSPEVARAAEAFWPGALTMVLPRRPGLDWDLGGDPATIGLRYPAVDPVLRLCRAVGPLATTSANHHGEPPLTSAADVISCFGDELAVLDGGHCDAPPSTVVDFTTASPTCVRRGGLGWERIASVLGPVAG